MNRGSARGLKLEYDRAIEDFTKAIELDPGRPTAWGLRGLARKERSERALARADFKRALELVPNDPQVRRWLDELGPE